MKTVTDFRRDCLVLLGDESGRRYSDSVIDMGFREALPGYGVFFPCIEEIQGRVVRYDDVCAVVPWIPGSGPAVRRVRRVSTGEELHCVMEMRPGELLCEFCDSVQPVVGELLLIEYQGSHTIKGLDDAKLTTIPSVHEYVLIKGAAGYAMRIRARSITEVFGKRPDDRAALMEQAEGLINEFLSELKHISLIKSFSGNPWPISNLRR